MVYNFKRMLLSNDYGDSSLALEILNNRDAEDVETQKCFEEIKKIIIVYDKLCPPQSEVWVVKVAGTITRLRNKGAFESKRGASISLTQYLKYVFSRAKNSYNEDPYYKMLGTIFNDYKKFRQFLIDNKIVEFVKLQ